MRMAAVREAHSGYLDRLELIMLDYAAGKSLGEIRKKHKKSNATLYRLLTQYGLPRRNSSRKASVYEELTDAQRRKLAEIGQSSNYMFYPDILLAYENDPDSFGKRLEDPENSRQKALKMRKALEDYERRFLRMRFGDED